MSCVNVPSVINCLTVLGGEGSGASGNAYAAPGIVLGFVRIDVNFLSLLAQLQLLPLHR